EVTFTSRLADTGNDFGNWYPATKSGMKFEDLDADGVKDGGEPGLPGWTIYVDYDNDGVKDAGEPFAVTAADGTYTITGITPGTWRVKEVAQAGWTQSYPALGYYEVTFTSRLADTGNDFGNWRYATKSGYKFMDDDRDGVFDPEELGLAGWTINLWTGSPGDLILAATTTTDANGYYEFDHIIPGVTYYVSEVIPNPVWIQTFPTPTTTGAMYIEGLGSVWVINLTSGEVHANNNFGNVYYHEETAWGYDQNGKAIELNDIVTEAKWGWTNGPYSLATLEDGITLELRAGVGLNDVDNKGALVGYVYASYDPISDMLTVRYETINNNMLTGLHLWVGSTPLPMKKLGKTTIQVASPGQFPYKWTGTATNSYTFTIDVSKSKFITNEDIIYIAAHADVRMYEIID
ncbi:MAG: SdrD B-like domain-containing protein, partial [Bacillota bacterium]|nr:SdrD B-like domain-containing protein [Bacillota bacterium]